MGTLFELSRLGAERTLNHGWAPRLQYDYDHAQVGALDVAEAATGAPQLVVDLYDPDDPRLWAQPVAEVSIGYLVPGGERIVPTVGRPLRREAASESSDTEAAGDGEDWSSRRRDDLRAAASAVATRRSGGRERQMLLRYFPVDVIAAYTAAVVLVRDAGAVTLQWLTGIALAVAVVIVAVQSWITARRTADQHRSVRPGVVSSIIGSWWELVATAATVLVWSAALPGSWADWTRFAETVSFGGWTAAEPGVVAFVTAVVSGTLLVLGTSIYQELARGRATRAVLRRSEVVSANDDTVGAAGVGTLARLWRRRGARNALRGRQAGTPAAEVSSATTGD